MYRFSCARSCAAQVNKTIDDTVSAGTMNQGGYLEVSSTKLSKDSAVQALVELIEDAQTNRSPTEIVVDRFAKFYTPYSFDPPDKARSALPALLLRDRGVLTTHVRA